MTSLRELTVRPGAPVTRTYVILCLSDATAKHAWSRHHLEKTAKRSAVKCTVQCLRVLLQNYGRTCTTSYLRITCYVRLQASDSSKRILPKVLLEEHGHTRCIIYCTAWTLKGAESIFFIFIFFSVNFVTQLRLDAVLRIIQYTYLYWIVFVTCTEDALSYNILMQKHYVCSR